MVAALTNETGAKPGKELAPISDKTLQAEASSAHSRINIPLNLGNWKNLPDEISGELLWFHQWVLDNDISFDDAREAIGYDNSTIFKVLKGNYEGNWGNVVKAIRSFRKLLEQRRRIQKSEFRENQISKIIFAALDYALANQSITVIEGESRMGKSLACKEWAERNNHGRSVFVTAPVVGGVAALIRRIAHRCGGSRNRVVNDVADSLYRAFNKNRILIVDEAHRALPNDLRQTNPQKIEFLRDLHDETGCAIAFIVTSRWSHHLKKGAYQYEQLIGRIGRSVRLKPKIKREHFLPIVQQFIATPSEALMATLEQIANQPGRLGILTETLRLASRVANQEKSLVSELHVRKAIAIRTQHSGEAE